MLIYFLYEENWGGWTNLPTHHLTGRQAATQFFTGYVLEKSLSVDNLFVIAMIFAFFAVPPAQQHRLLFWGIFGAVVLRGVMIALGAVLIARFDWIVYIFGALLLLSAVKMLVMRHDNIDPDKNLAVRLVRRFYPVPPRIEDGRFFVRHNGRRAATPLLLALVLVETSDVMFAVDSTAARSRTTIHPQIAYRTALPDQRPA